MQKLFGLFFLLSFSLFSAPFSWEFPAQTIGSSNNLFFGDVPDIASNDLGYVVVVYPDTSIRARYSKDFGMTWSPEVSISRDVKKLYPGFSPKVAMDAFGNVIALWINAFTLEVERNVINLDVETWGQKSVVFSGGNALGEPKLAMDDNGNAIAVVLMHITTTARILKNESIDFGQTWAGQTSLKNFPYPLPTLTPVPTYFLTMDDNGNAIIAYRKDVFGSTDVIYTSAPFTWSGPVTVSSSPPVALTNNNSGNAVLLVMENDGSYDRIKSFSSNTYGASWTAEQFISAAGENVQVLPTLYFMNDIAAISILDDQHVVALWKAGTNPYTVKANYSLNSGVSWDLAKISTLSANNVMQNSSVFVAMQPTGLAIASWRINNGFFEVIESNHSLDFGKTWQALPLPLSSGSVSSWGNEISLDSNFAWITWSESPSSSFVQVLKGNLEKLPIKISVIKNRLYNFWLQKEFAQEVFWEKVPEAVKYNIYEGKSGLVIADGATPIFVVLQGEKRKFIIHDVANNPKQYFYITWESDTGDESAPLFFSSIP